MAKAEIYERLLRGIAATKGLSCRGSLHPRRGMWDPLRTDPAFQKLLDIAKETRNQEKNGRLIPAFLFS